MIAPVPRKDNNKNEAVQGDIISFQKHGVECEGKVIAVYDNSVCVDIISHGEVPTKVELQDRTIVSHKRYKVL